MVALLRGSEIEVKAVEWLWKPMIPFGDVTIVQGDGGDGKTTMMLTIAAKLSKGILPPSLEDDLLVDAPTIAPASTIYLTTENKAGSVAVPKFEKAGGDKDFIFFNNELEQHMTLTKEELTEAIDITKARLIVIDPLQAFLPNGVSMGNMVQMRNIISMVTNVAEEKNCAVVLIGHLNKNERGRAIHRGLGSVDIATAVRSILLVEADKKDETIRYVRNIKSNFDGAEHARVRLKLDEEHRLSFQEAARDKENTQVSHAAFMLLEMLQNGALPVAEINKIFQKEGISSKTAGRARQRIGAIPTHKGRNVMWELPLL